MSEYVPSPTAWVADHVRRYEAIGGTDGGELRGMPVVIVTHTGRKTGSTRKTPLMRVKVDAGYVLVGSLGGAPKSPQWVANLLANPDVTVQDRAEVHRMRVRLVDDPDEKAPLWAAANAAFPDYDAYQARTERSIPIFLAEPRE